MANSDPSLVERIRSVYLERLSGTVEPAQPQRSWRLYFRQGELFVETSHPGADDLSRALPACAASDASFCAARHAELRRLTNELADHLIPSAPARLRRHTGSFEGLVGPLPTVCLVMRLAVSGTGEEAILRRLGGLQARFASNGDTPALRELPGLDPEMLRILPMLEPSLVVEELLIGSRDSGREALRALASLWGAGLARRIEKQEDRLLSPRMLEGFLDRIADDLHDRPVTQDAAEHRRQVADLLGRHGQLDHYQFFEIGARAEEAAIHAAYNRMARLVHPIHAEGLGLSGRESALRVLFERATEAYLALSDVERRLAYNAEAGIDLGIEVDAAQRREEKRQLARQNYRRGINCLATMDYSLAVDLLKEAARLDPQAEYFSRLGQAQARNPKWRRQAVDSYQQAIELCPEDSSLKVALGEILEAMDRRPEARAQYAAALEIEPDRVDVKEALKRL